MRHTDIAIVGGGLAGSTAAAMLGRAGHRVVLVDPRGAHPPELRCEKLDGPQVRILRKTGLAEAVLRAATFDGAAWVARFGTVLDKRPGDQYGILYDGLVNAVRAELPPCAEFVQAKAVSLSTGPDRQHVTLSNGEEISARLAVLANGLNIGLRHSLGLVREELSKCHSITVGFDIGPLGRRSFDFPALTYYPELGSRHEAYLTLFPIGSAMRANLMVYRDMNDPWLRRMRKAPEAALLEIMPGLARLMGGFEVTGDVRIRPADLYVTRGVRQPGVVLVGDAFATSCPAAGTGVGKVFTDVERLCNVHIPRWLASDGMDVEKIAAFYKDPVKRAYDAHSLEKAYALRALSTENGLPWQARRWGRFAARLASGVLRQARSRFRGVGGEASVGALSKPFPQ